MGKDNTDKNAQAQKVIQTVKAWEKIAGLVLSDLIPSKVTWKR